MGWRRAIGTALSQTLPRSSACDNCEDFALALAQSMVVDVAPEDACFCSSSAFIHLLLIAVAL